MSSSSASSLRASGRAPSMSASAIVAKAASGSHVLKIEGYSRTLGLGNGRFITSRSFEIGGHRCYLRYYPDSYLSSSHEAHDCTCILLCLDPSSEAGQVRAQWKLSLLHKEGHPVASYVWKSQACSAFSGKLEPPNSRMFIDRKMLVNYLKDDAFSVRCDINVDLGIVTEDVMIPAVDRGIKRETHGV